MFVVVVSFTTTARAQQEPASPRLVIAGGGELPAAVYQRFLEMAGEQPQLVVIPTASDRNASLGDVQKLWRSRGFTDVRLLHSTDRDAISSDEFLAPLKTATAVWFGGGQQQRIADAYLGTAVEEQLYRLLRRGVVIGGTSAGAAIQSRVMIAGGTREPRITTGLDLLPDAIVDQHFLRRNRIPRLLSAIRTHTERIGFGIDEGTALIVQNDKAEVVGNSYVIRVESAAGSIQLDAYGDGESVPLGALRIEPSRSPAADGGKIKIPVPAPRRFDSYRGLVMTGYQGWLNTVTDGAGSP